MKDNFGTQFKWTLWKSFIEYVVKITLLWLAIISVIVAIIHFVVLLWLKTEVPIQYWIIIVLVGVFVAQFLTYHSIAKRQIPAEVIEDSLKRIAELRTEGVELRNNESPTVKTKEDMDKFRDKFMKWKQTLISEVEIVSPSQAKIFQTIDLYIVRYTSVSKSGEIDGELVKIVNIITEYTDRIKEFVDKFSLENLANRVRK